ncbi:exosome complex component Rrp40 [Brevipalpus obovatus]|uniref:exosome complex component Rrp40 n=1 Tax=Brevipalpus obovatus TaxID=246614 RepID=UPI003D9E80CC
MSEPLIVFPGFSVDNHIENNPSAKNKKVILGPGIRRDVDDVRAIKCGILRSRLVNNDTQILYWIDSHQKRYVAVRGERVIGIVVGKGSLTVNVDIGTNETASLSLLAFESATKRNRPNVQLGDIIFARILSASKDVRTELTCVTSRLKKDGLGVLPPNGFMINVPLRVCRRLLSTDNKIIETLGSKFKFEITIGLNGRLWVRSSSVSKTIYIINVLMSIEDKNIEQIEKLSQEISQKFELTAR